MLRSSRDDDDNDGRDETPPPTAGPAWLLCEPVLELPPCLPDNGAKGLVVLASIVLFFSILYLVFEQRASEWWRCIYKSEGEPGRGGGRKHKWGRC
jgi:hypothetical protein